MKPTAQILEFDRILTTLAGFAQSATVKAKLLALEPYLDERECLRRMEETTEARRVFDALGSPPIPSMKTLEDILTGAGKGIMLLPEQLTAVAAFLSACKRMRSYLKRSEYLGVSLSSYADAIAELGDLRDEIETDIRNDQVDDAASPALRDIRRRIDNLGQQVRAKLDQVLKSRREIFSDGSPIMRSGRFVLPVKREYKSQLPGSVVDVSASGSTYFIEPASVGRLQEEITAMEIEEDGEVRRILYTLTALVEESLTELRLNAEAFETLDFAFAKAKLSAEWDAIPVPISSKREIVIRSGRHPLLPKASCVPLDFRVGNGGITGVVITGPNTGGKTVTLKTVGLLSMMAQCGLHVPAAEGSCFSMHNAYYCDIGDGQSIDQNLSTFSSHITNITEILSKATAESLVLLDEVGSGTDPAEGMGIAIAILGELRRIGCLFAATTHYPEVKSFAAETDGLLNARMAFDRESLRPLYRLELGEAGESCALYIAQRLGFPSALLQEAYRAAYLQSSQPNSAAVPTPPPLSAESNRAKRAPAPHVKKLPKEKPVNQTAARFHVGDSVEVQPDREVGIVYRPANERGEVCVQIKGKKRLIPHKRIKLLVPASELYPPDYDFSIVFDSVQNRKAERRMQKRHDPSAIITHEDESDWK